MLDIMVDLETMGKRFDAPILTIGAVKFDIETGKIGDELYGRIAPNNAFNFGRPDGDTMLWWMEQSAEARSQAMGGNRDLPSTLEDFAKFCGSDATLWGNGPTFDITITEHGMARTGVKPTWEFWNINCCRTIKRIATRRGWSMPPREGVHHDALDDARYQAKWVSSAWRFLQRNDEDLI